MTRGTLRVLLGAAPGVGKTYAMLQEGHQLAAEGRDVVLALVETHDREPTAALVDGLEMVPRRGFTHRGVQLSDMDLAAVLARAPEIALVDELAHTNVGTGGERETLAGRARAARCRDRRDLHRQRAAHRVPRATWCGTSPGPPSARPSPMPCCGPRTRSSWST